MRVEGIHNTHVKEVVDIRCLPLMFSNLVFLRQGLSELRASQLSRLAGRERGGLLAFALAPVPCPGLQMHTLCPAFYVSAGNLKSRLCAGFTD